MAMLAPVDSGLFIRILEADGWREIARSDGFVGFRKEGRFRPVTVPLDIELQSSVLVEKLENGGMKLGRYIELLNRLRPLDG